MNKLYNSFHKSIIEYIIYEINTKNYSADSQESLEVAKQCLETAWNIEDGLPSNNLLKLFELGNNTDIDNKLPILDENIEVGDEDKMAAERLKTQGNICMGESLFADAVSCYSKAIELDPRNAVYYCNRAAAYSKLNKNESAIDDCKLALKIDSTYCKAYSRMGLAYTAMGNYNDAIICYKRAIEIEPDNVNYKQNLQAAEERKASGVNAQPSTTNATGSGMPNLQSALQNFDLSSILNNPVMMNMAQQMISQPEMRNMMTQMMQSMIPQGGAPAPSEQPGSAPNASAPDAPAGVGESTDINEFLTMGQQMAQQLHNANPELVDSLRNRFYESSNPENPNAKEQ